jgi:uncharacterized membrane protein YhdT
MGERDRWSWVLGVSGLVLMLVGAVDPLEGSLLILPGTALAALAAWRSGTDQRRRAYWAFGLTLLGVAVLFGLSSLGGVGGSTGRWMWWLLFCLPYPVGWVLGLVTVVRMLHQARTRVVSPG